MDEMKKILILGCGGAGKSTLGRILSERCGLPLIHLDYYYWNPGWVETATDKWRNMVAGFAGGAKWIIEGNYINTIDLRMPKADTVIYMDYPMRLCLFRAFYRRFQYFFKQRPDIAQGCREKFDFEFFLWILNFKRDVKPQIMEAISKYGEGKKIIILNSSKEYEAFLNSL